MIDTATTAAMPAAVLDFIHTCSGKCIEPGEDVFSRLA